MSVPRFWREIPQRYNLQASQCQVCEALHYPPRSICPTCRRDSVGNMGRRNLTGRARVLAVTRVHKPAPGYEHQVPYWSALLETEDGPRLVGQLVDMEGIEPFTGMRVEAAFRRIAADGDAGVIHYGIKWRPLRGEPLEEDAEE